MSMKTNLTHLTPLLPHPVTSQSALVTHHPPPPQQGQANHSLHPQKGSGTDGGQGDRQLPAQRSHGRGAGTASDTELTLREDRACGTEFIFNILCFLSPSLLG